MPRVKRSTEPKALQPKAGKSKSAAPSTRPSRPQRPRRSSRPVWAVLLMVIAVVAIGILIARVVSDAMPWQYAGEIEPLDAQEMMLRGAVVVDVRTYDEYINGHIEGSLLMPLEELPTLMQALPKDQLIITVCRTGVRSIQARYILQEAGFPQVTSLKGGMQAWIAQKLPVVYGDSVRKYN